jgi:CBS domain-containing protein
MNLDRPIELILKEKGTKVHTVAADASVYEALVMMAEREIGALVVMDGDEFVGVFSERDYARKVVLVGRTSKETTVREIMSGPVHTVGPKSTVDECMQHMTDKRCRHLPVVENGKIVGIVSIGDLVHWIIQTQDRAIHDLEDYITGEYPH